MKKILAAAFIMIFLTSCVSISDRYVSDSRFKSQVSRKTSKTKNIKESKTIQGNQQSTINNQQSTGPIDGDGDIDINVLIMTASRGFTISSDSNISASKPDISATKRIAVAYRKGNIVLNDYPTSASEVTLRSSSNFRINKKQFRGDMLIKKAGKKIYLINRLPLDYYLYGVLPSEISPSWHRECLRAQAVAARSFAIYNKLHAKQDLYDVDSTVTSQVYKGFNVEAKKTNEAVKDTNREVLTHNNEIIEAFFHANSGGRTAGSQEVWGGKLPYLRSVEDQYCSEGKHYKWKLDTSTSKLSASMAKNGLNTGEIYNIKITEKTTSGRAGRVKVYGGNGTFDVKGNDFRRYVGVDKLRSTNFSLRFAGSKIVFDGYGWGHGVGLSQEGSRGMAERGMSYKAILYKFYNDVKIKKIK